MNLNKMYGLFLRHFYLIKSSLPRILDLIYWPTIQIILWGFISKFFSIYEKLDMFCDLNGDTVYPKSEKILQRAVTRIVLPAPEDVPCIINDFTILFLQVLLLVIYFEFYFLRRFEYNFHQDHKMCYNL